MAELQDFNYKGYKIDPTLSDRELIKQLEDLPEFKMDPGKDIPLAKLIRYIILMYDINTEMSVVYPEVGIRKRECAAMAGFKMDEDGLFPELLEMTLLGENPMVNDMIVRFIRLFENPYYLTYVTSFNLLYTEIAKSFSDQQSRDVKIMNENIMKLNKQISDLSEVLFRGDDLISLKKALYKNMERENLGLRPEEVAVAIARGKYKPSINPFGYPK